MTDSKSGTYKPVDDDLKNIAEQFSGDSGQQYPMGEDTIFLLWNEDTDYTWTGTRAAFDEEKLPGHWQVIGHTTARLED